MHCTTTSCIIILFEDFECLSFGEIENFGMSAAFGSKMQAALTILAYVDSSGELRVVASDAAGRWHSSVNFVSGRLSLGSEEGTIRCHMMAWTKTSKHRVETSGVKAFNPLHLQAARAMLKTKLQGLEVKVTEEGVVVMDRKAYSREKVETANMWLTFAAQYAAAKNQFDSQDAVVNS